MLRHPRRWLIIVLICTGVAAGAWYTTRPRPIEVVVRPVERGTVEKMVANTRAGTLKACREANLSPGVGGQIAVLNVRKGDAVKKGQLLLVLWNNDLAAQLTLAESEEKAAIARAAAARSQAENAQREATRLLGLRRIGAVSEKETDRAVTEAQVRRAEHQAARAAAATSRNRLGVIRAELERTRLIAPFDGIVAEINGELNEYVTPSPPGIATPPTVVLLDTSCFYVTAPIDEVDAPAVAVGMPARVSLDAYGDRHFNGRVRRIAPYVLDVEKQARTVDVEVEFTGLEPGHGFLAGYSADVEIIADVHRDTLSIPTPAVLKDNRVFVYNTDSGRLQSRSITPGIANWERTEVVKGLAQGERVVLSVDREGVKENARTVASEKP
ncbi:MAG: efflux RND transporter periplasmic adaptor subunit [Desulfobulbaceae bacterium]|nr:efflux RND transporter periplasmic adaptor subunit [Desulfobulbaceae bacterium]